MLFGKKKKIPEYTFYQQTDTKIVEEKQSYKTNISDQAMDELNQLIGLDSVKKQIAMIQNTIKAETLRKENGLQSNDITMHMMLLGNPGTGKTECARLIAKIYFGLGLLPTDAFYEVSRKDLVTDGYRTSSDKVDDAVKKALGGVLFIDEAYSLCYGNNDPAGKEAVDALIKLMEDKRKDIAIILAGYTNEMKELVAQNPGFTSRIPPQNVITFPDYTLNEKVEIFKVFINKNGLKLASDCTDDLIASIIKTSPDGGNARDIRNITDRIRMELNNKLAETQNFNKEDLILITADILERVRN